MSALVARISSLPRSRLVIAGLALLTTLTIVTGFLLESRWGYSERVVKIVFAQSWPDSRSVDDVRADRAREEAAALAAAAESRRYIASLPPAARVKAKKQYDDFMAAQPANLRPADWVPPPPPVDPAAAPAAAAPAAAPKG